MDGRGVGIGMLRFNPLNRGVVILTPYYVIVEPTCKVSFNPLNRGVVILTRQGEEPCSGV